MCNNFQFILGEKLKKLFLYDLLLPWQDWLVALCLVSIRIAAANTVAAAFTSYRNTLKCQSIDDQTKIFLILMIEAAKPYRCSSKTNTSSTRTTRRRASTGSSAQTNSQIQPNFAITLMATQNKHHFIIALLYIIAFGFFCRLLRMMRLKENQDFSILLVYNKAATKTIFDAFSSP